MVKFLQKGRNNTMTDLDCFIAFLKYKIDSGFKQVSIATSDKVNLSTAYINKLYKNPPKNVTVETQSKIADFFGLSYEEMIEEGRQILKGIPNLQGPKPQSINRRRASDKIDPKEPAIVQEQLYNISSWIQHNYDHLLKIEAERDNTLALLNLNKNCICIVDANLRITFQNAEHKKYFGPKEKQKYKLFWDDGLSEEQLESELLYGDYGNKIITHNNKAYLAQIVTSKNINKIVNVFEQITRLDDLECEKHLPPKKDTKIEIYHKIFKHLDHGFGFFNKARILEIASNKFNLIDPKYNFPEIQPTVDQLLLDLSERVKGGVTVVSSLKKAYENRSEIDIEVVVDGDKYNFQTLNIIEKDTYEGTLLIVRRLR